MKSKLSGILIDISKAYMAAAPLFHDHFKQMFELSLYSNITLKSKYIHKLYDELELYDFVDSAVKYRLGISKDAPNSSKLIYSMANPYATTVILDDILEKIMYSAYPLKLIQEFKHYLECYIHDERIVDLMLSKLEVEMQK